MRPTGQPTDADPTRRAPLRRGGTIRLPGLLLLATAALVTVGVAISVAGAVMWRSSQRSRERQDFNAVAHSAVASLGSMILRDADFVATVRGVLTMVPQMSDSAFKRWYEVLSGKERQAGGIGSAVVRELPAAQLKGFEAARNSDPAFRALLGSWLRPVSRDGQSHYCLLADGGNVFTLSRFTAELVQQDWCLPSSATGSSQAPILSTAAETGQLLALPVELPWLQTMFLEAAFYRQGAPLDTPAARRSAVRGWLVSSFDIRRLIAGAIGHAKGLNITLYHLNPGGKAILLGSAGQTPAAGAQRLSARLSIYGTWIVRVSGQSPSPVLGTDAIAVLIFLAGTLLTLLIAALAILLARSRERALALVAQKSGELHYRALHDPLTGLPNRSLAIDRAEQMLARAQRERNAVVALSIDIDGFKQLNETLGHAGADELLREVATRLEGMTRGSDTAARLPGDEFIVLVEGGQYSADPEIVAERMLELLREPYGLHGKFGRPVQLTISIGLALGIDDSADKLLADAAIALDAAKASGRNCYVFFDSEMQRAARERLELEMDLGEALGREELFVVYQPIFDLRDGRVSAAEALLRWRHPRLGIVSPDKFIPAAEASGLIIPIGRWVLEIACRQALSWRERGLSLGMAVNVSARQLESDKLIDDVRLALLGCGLEPEALTLEVTETTLMSDPEASARRLWALADLGVKIAIDDFGTGYSSLAYLRQFPVHSLKIDRSFIAAISESPSATMLVQTMIALSHNLGLETVAEGVENAAQLKLARDLGCELGQGFLLARPLPAAQIDQLLASDLDELALKPADDQAAGAQ